MVFPDIVFGLAVAVMAVYILAVIWSHVWIRYVSDHADLMRRELPWLEWVTIEDCLEQGYDLHLTQHAIYLMLRCRTADVRFIGNGEEFDLIEAAHEWSYMMKHVVRDDDFRTLFEFQIIHKGSGGKKRSLNKLLAALSLRPAYGNFEHA